MTWNPHFQMYHPHFRDREAHTIVFALAILANERPHMKENCESVIAAFSSLILESKFKEEYDFFHALKSANKITWTCHVCGKERPDALISVHKRDISERFNLPSGTVSENVRYCNDSDECREKAREYRHLK